VRAAAATVRGNFGQVRLLINNAGITTMRHQMSADGFELTFATNHLGPFLLTELLRERMAVRGRIITVASRVHLRGELNLAGVRSAPRCFNPLAAYAQSKLANVLHTFALARRLAGTPVTANCLHPGVVASNLLPRWLRVIKPLISPQMFDVERGAGTTLYLALADAVESESGKYFDEFRMVQPALAAADDIALQEALWEASTRWVGLPASSRRLF
jgi:NAD(P)-dependent dehydrogenase (short-subunit alcohol dehydrogenase family)